MRRWESTSATYVVCPFLDLQLTLDDDFGALETASPRVFFLEQERPMHPNQPRVNAFETDESFPLLRALHGTLSWQGSRYLPQNMSEFRVELDHRVVRECCRLQDEAREGFARAAPQRKCQGGNVDSHKRSGAVHAVTFDTHACATLHFAHSNEPSV